MQQVRNIDKMSTTIFLDTYFLKEELVHFCRTKGLPITGSKIEITERIAHFLNTGIILEPKTSNKTNIEVISYESLIPNHIGFSENLRAFFKQELGNDFHFHVPFQRWLKANVGKTLRDAIQMYPQLQVKSQKIDKQFEYNTYIRDFFQHTNGYGLKDAIECWNYKKQQSGKHEFEIEDLRILNFD